MHIQYWCASDTGPVRAVNEDAFLTDRRLGLAVVADGVAGQFRGDLAATLACRVVRESILDQIDEVIEHRKQPSRSTRKRVIQVLRRAVQTASYEIFRTGQALSGGIGMSCTIEVALIIESMAFFAHVGDSRIIVLREGKAYQLTEDHTVRSTNILTRAVGLMPSVQVDTLSLPLKTLDQIVLCSDGLTRTITTEDLPELIQQPSHRCLTNLIAEAQERGSKDNITVVVIGVSRQLPMGPGITARQLQQIRTIPHFEAATSRELLNLFRLLETRKIGAGNTLYRQGDPSTELYFVIQGHVTLSEKDKPALPIGPGQSFGHELLCGINTRKTTAMVTSKSQLLALHQVQFGQLKRQHPALVGLLLQGVVATLLSDDSED